MSMNPITQLLADVARARHNGVNFGDEWRKVDGVLAAFADKYEEVTVRSLRGSLEVGRPNDAGGYDYWISSEGADPLPAIMLKRKRSDVTKTACALRAARALLDACERGGTIGNEADTLRVALSDREGEE